MTNIGLEPRGDIRAEALRYVINGLIATAAHFTVLTGFMELVSSASAGLANLVASCVGITVSFLGNRYFVFRPLTGTLSQQAARFATLYIAIACLHAGLLFVWTDLWGFDYRIGFLIAVALQVVLGYWGNRSLVFNGS
jgi:putative flippase GtrA